MRNKFFTLTLLLLSMAFMVNAQNFTKADIKAVGNTKVQSSLVGKNIPTEKVMEKADLPAENVFVQSSHKIGSKGDIYSQDFSEGLPVDWAITDNAGNGVLWVFDNPGGRTINTATAANGFAIVDSDDAGSVDVDVDLVSQDFDFSGNAIVIVEFQHYFRQFSTASTGTFDYSIDGGANWINYETYTASTANAELFSADMSLELAGQATVKFRWHYEGNWAYYWAIDDIYIYEPEAYMFAVSAPGGVVVKEGMSHDYVVDISNLGAADDNFAVASVGNGAWTYELLQADSATALTDPIMIAAGADSSFVIRVTLPADGLTLGQEDMASFSVTSAEGSKEVKSFDITTEALTPYSVPFNEDFTEYIPANWTEFSGIIANPTVAIDESSTWMSDGFANNGTTGAARVNIWSTSSDEWLVTPEIELGTGIYKLTFDLALTTYSGTTASVFGEDDKFAVVVSTDGGATWNLDDTLLYYDNTHVFTIDEKVELDLSAYVGNVIMLGFYGESTVSNEDNNLFIDNLSVYEVFENDLSVIDINPTWGWEGDDVTPLVSLYNVGSLTQNDFTVDVVVNDGTSDVYTSSKSVTGAGLASGGTVEVTMDDVWSSPAAGEYTITATVTLAGDGDASNDVMVSTYNAVNPTYDLDKVYAFNASDWTLPDESASNLMGVDVFTGEMIDIGATSLSGMYAGDFIGNIGEQELYGVIDTSVYLIDGDGSTYYMGGVSGMDAGAGTLGMAWDAVTEDVYVTDGNNILYTVAENSGALTATPIDTIELADVVMGLASNSLGELYAVTLGDTLYTIDKVTAVPTKIGYLGIDINYAQDIGFDRTNDILYGTFYKGSGTGGLYTVDLTTGEATQVGVDFGDELTVCAVYGNPQYDVNYVVTDGTNPIAGAEITIFNRTLTTDVNGEALTSLINGDYDYDVALSPYGPVFGTATVADADQTINITMEAAYDVTFTVTDGTDPIVGAAIAVNDVEMGVTDASGVLVVGLSDGTYNYTVTAAGFADIAGSVTVAGAVLAEDVVMDPVYTVTFTVADEFATVMEGATVSIDGQDLTTDAAGEVAIDLVAGNYPYAVNMAGYTETTGSVDVVDAAVAVDAEMMLIRYTITFNAEDNVSTPLEGVNINVEGTVVTTDTSGVALLDTINGTYAYTATLSGYAAVLGEVVVADGDIAETITFAEAAYTVTFTVNDGTNPIEGATVAVDGLDGLTDASGVIAFDLPAGDHDYTVTFAGYDDYTGTVTVVDAPVAVPAITMVETQYNITFVVKDEWSVAVEGATITIGAEDIVTNASGVATFQRVAGTYDWTSVATGYDDGAGSVEVINSNKTVNVEMIAYRYTATFTVDNVLGTLLEGASIEIDAQTINTDAAGEATIELPNGDYPYTVTLAGYDEFTGSITVADADLAEAVEMLEAFVDPYGLMVDIEGYNATFSWNNSQGYSDDFESYDDFVLEFSPWTLVDVDGLATYGFNGVSFTNSGEAMAGIIFNPSATEPALTESPAYSGEKYMAVFNPSDASACNDWMISPKTGIMANGQVSFMARGGNASYSAEQFQVFVSTTDTDPASFTSVSDVVTCPSGSIDWVQYTYSLDAYVGQEVYVGIHVTSVDQFYFCVDDFTIGAADSKVALGFNVYLDGAATPVNDEPITETNYLFEGLDLGAHTAGVEAVYTTGVSQIVEMDFTIDGTYPITFNVTDGANPVEGASIVINTETLTTDAAGVATINLADGTYDYTVTAPGYGDITDQVVVSGAAVTVDIAMVGFGEVNADFSIYPNPTTGMVYIKTQGTNEITVLNAIGNVVKTQQIEGNGQLDLTGFADGIYFIRLKSDNSVATKRIIIE